MKDSNASERTTNAKRNICFGFIQVVVSMVLPFVVRTILIYRFGVDYLGLNSLFTSILSVLSLMELGFGTAVVFSLYKPVAENDSGLICAFLTYFRKMYRIIGLVIVVVGLLLLPFLKYLIHDASMPGGLNLYICYLIFLGNTVISYWLYGYLTVIPTAYQRKDLLSKVDICISFLAFIVKSVLLLASDNFYLYLLSLPIITVIHNLVCACLIRRKYPELVCRGELDYNQKQDLNRRVRGLFIEKVTSVSRNSIDTLCISAFIGLTVTGKYNNYFYIMTSVIAVSTMLLNSMMAGVGNSIAVENPEKNYADMKMFDYIYTGAAGWSTICLLCLYQPFIKIWLGDDMLLGMPVVVALCAYFYILKSGDIRWVYHEGKGLWYESRFIMIGEAAVNVFLNIILCKVMGVLGIVLATVVSVFITNFIFCPRLLFKMYFKNNKLQEYWKDHIAYTVTMLLTAGICWMICEEFLPVDMIEMNRIWNCIFCLGGRLLICTVLAVVVFWLIWHKSERYSKARKWLKRVVRL